MKQFIYRHILQLALLSPAKSSPLCKSDHHVVRSFGEDLSTALGQGGEGTRRWTTSMSSSQPGEHSGWLVSRREKDVYIARR